MENIIKVSGLKKYFKEVRAVDDISFAVKKGELFGFLGVNGAGKSTTINMMCTLLLPTAGEIEICGYLAGKEDEEIRKHIGVVWQNNCLDGKLTVKENLYVRGSMYGKKQAALKNSIDRVCEKLQLQDIYPRRYETLSGGQKRRCEIAAALVNTPELLFLDEPTTGLDPATRKLVWESVDQLRREDGMTVFLTTHYMEEATRANHIAVIDSGRIKVFGTPFELKELYTHDKLRLAIKRGNEEQITCELNQIAEANPEISYEKRENNFLISIPDSMSSLPILSKLENKIEGFELLQGTMDDAFLEITGRTLEEGKELYE